MKTKHIRHHEPTWFHVDASGKVLGKLATEVAGKLRGKQKVSFVQHWDCGDHVVVTNASEVVLTGLKLQQKSYFHHSRWPGGIKERKASDLQVTDPAFLIQNAVKGMLPKNKLQNEWMKRLHVYAGAEHPHVANLAGKEKA